MRLSLTVVCLAAAAGLCARGGAQQHPRDFAIHDADTRSWWHTTEALSNDAMEGRDTGSPAYQRAAEYVAKRFENAGLKPAGDNGTYFQTVPMHEVAVVPEGTSFTLERPGGGQVEMSFLQEIAVTPFAGMPAETRGALTFRGYCGKDAMAGIAGKFVVCYGARRQGLPGAAERVANARAGKALGILNVDDAAFVIEPPRWPEAYARSVTLRGGTGANGATGGNGAEGGHAPGGFLTVRISTGAFAKIVGSAEHEPGALLTAAAAKQPLPSFDPPGTLVVKVRTAERVISSPNVLAVLPGTDPALKDQYVVVAAHLDGYGFGTPVNGDGLYNGALTICATAASGQWRKSWGTGPGSMTA
jgi:hypothetical protein